MRLVDSVMEAMLTALIAADAPLDPDGVWVAVATAINDQGGATTMTDVTAPPGTVATRVPVGDWTGPYKMADGRWAVEAPVAHFLAADSDDGCVLTHWLLADALTAGGLLGFGLITPNITIVDENSSSSVVVRVTLDPDGRWDATLTWNG